MEGTTIVAQGRTGERDLSEHGPRRTTLPGSHTRSCNLGRSSAMHARGLQMACVKDCDSFFRRGNKTHSAACRYVKSDGIVVPIAKDLARAGGGGFFRFPSARGRCFLARGWEDSGLLAALTKES